MTSLFYGCARLRPDSRTVINANWMIPQGLVAIAVKAVYSNAAVVTTVRGSDIFGLQGRLMRRLKRLVLKHSDAVVVNSSQMLRACEDIYVRSYVQTPTGYDEKIYYKTSDKSQYKSGDTLRLISVGRLSEEKGFIYLLRALRKLLDLGLNLQLQIAGEGPLRHELETFITENSMEKNVQLLGWVQSLELADLYRYAHLFVGTSVVTSSGQREAFGNVYAESMACGTPVIVSDSAGNSEIIQHKVNGMVVRTANYNDVVDAVQYVYEHPDKLKRMGEHALKTIQPYSKSVTRDKYIEIIDKLIKSDKQ
jgi:glycosyltransferase involved in cell wall biosynthesis